MVELRLWPERLTREIVRFLDEVVGAWPAAGAPSAGGGARP
jgi:hypothetical protein